MKNYKEQLEKGTKEAKEDNSYSGYPGFCSKEVFW
jgi:hypothetical protein